MQVNYVEVAYLHIYIEDNGQWLSAGTYSACRLIAFVLKQWIDPSA